MEAYSGRAALRWQPGRWAVSDAPTPAPAPPQSYRRSGSCPCARCRRRGLTWPFLLIVIGGIFLIDQFVPGINIGDLWPVILIAIGVLKLIESTASMEGHQG